MFDLLGSGSVSGRRTRKQLKMQRRGMEQAIAAGWGKHSDDEGSSSSDDDNVGDTKPVTSSRQSSSTRIVEVTPESSGAASIRSVKESNSATAAATATAPASSLTSPVGVTAKSLGSLQIFTPEHVYSRVVNVRSSPHAATATSGSSEADEEIEDDDDEDVSLAESQSQDGTALADTPELNSILNDLLLQSSCKAASTTSREQGTQKKFSTAASAAASTRNSRDATEATIDPTETESTEVDDDDDFFPMAQSSSPATKVTGILSPAAAGDRCNDNGNHTSDSELDDESDDGDSLDLGGVATTIWSKKQRNLFLPSTTNRAAKMEIAKLSSLPTLNINTSEPFNVSLELDDDDYYTDEEEQHEGGELFMLREGLRYTRTGDDAAADSNGNDNAASDSPSKSNNANMPPKVAARDVPTVDSCFGGIQLLTPKFFTGNQAIPAATPIAAAATTPVVKATVTPSTLSSIVHHMDPNLFDAKAKKSTVPSSPAVPGEAVSTPSPVKGVPLSVLQSEQIALDSENRKANLSSSFKSSTKSTRVAYNLTTGKKSMSRIERVYSKSFLPNQNVSSRAKEFPKSSHSHSSQASLSVLLADLRSKIFEVVSCDVNRETTVGDILSKARSLATDPALSEQKYVSFCYGTQEFGAPMLPVSVLIDWDKHRTRPLVVAVPMGSTAAEMQSVKRVLWKNPKLKEWWGQRDPFSPSSKPKASSKRTKSSAIKKDTDTSTLAETEGAFPTIIETPSVASS